MVYQLNSEKLDNKIMELDCIVNDELLPIINRMNDRMKDVKWVGKSHDMFCSKYAKILNSINNTPYKLLVCLTILSRTLENYAMTDEEVRGICNEIEEELQLKILKMESNNE